MPIILYSLVIAAVIPFLLAWLGGFYRVKQFGRFDNRHPRQQQALLEGTGARVNAAQMNAWEALSIYTVTVFIAFASGLDLMSLDKLAVAFITFRLLHAMFYILDHAWLRSIAFVLAFLCCANIVYLAANVTA